MRITVTAPTGNVGSRVVRLLVQAGERPTVLLRDPDRLDPAIRDAVDVRCGDLTDERFVHEATAGTDALFWLDTTPHFGEDPIAESDRLGEIAAAAVTAHGIARTVFVSSVGAERRDGAGHIDGLARIEQRLDTATAAAGLAVTHLRCGYFFTNLLLDPEALESGVLRATVAPDTPMAWVDPRDIGEVVAARLLSTAWSGRCVQAVHGPADLTYTDVVDVLGAVTGRPFRYEQISDDDLRSGLTAAGLGDRAVEGIVGMAASARDLVPEQPRSVLSTTPTTLAAWAGEHLR